MRNAKVIRLHYVSPTDPATVNLTMIDADEIAAVVQRTDMLSDVILKGGSWIIGVTGSPDQIYNIINS